MRRWIGRIKGVFWRYARSSAVVREGLESYSGLYYEGSPRGRVEMAEAGLPYSSKRGFSGVEGFVGTQQETAVRLLDPLRKVRHA